MISYVLDKDISGEKLLQDINNLVENFRKSNSDKIPILYIDIRTISHEDTSLIPKIEYKKPVDCST